MKKIKIFGVVCLGLILVAGGFLGAGYLQYQRDFKGYAGETQEFEIKKGMNLTSITRLLKEKRLISSKPLFYWAARFSGQAAHFKRGVYQVEGAVSPARLVEILSQGKEMVVRVTIPEGYRMTEIFEVLRKSGLKNSGTYEALTRDLQFIDGLGLPGNPKLLEGFLFPETYLFSAGVSEKEVLTRMVQAFLAKLPPNYSAQAAKVGLSSYQALTLASIIEKETGKASERRIISSVFHNRLKQGMRLQTDPTVIYGIEGYKGNLTKKHLTAPTPYNTYTIKGLPPSPIASPGIGAIEAAVNPAPTPYLYFVGKGDGSHQFTQTYKEHEQAVSQYQRRRRKDYRSY